MTRFIIRDASGEVRLPRVVDDSIGMWALRRVADRRLGERPWDDELPDDHATDPNASDSTRAALGAINTANAPDPTLVPARVAPARYAATRRRMHEVVASPTPALDLRRRTQARRTRPTGWRRWFAALGLVAAVPVVVAVALGLMLMPRAPLGQVLDSTGRPQSGQTVVVPSYGAASSPGASAVQVSVAGDSTAPVTAIVRVTKAAIPGHSVLNVTVRWSITDPGSDGTTELFQWRTDHDAWVTVRLPSSTTRTVALRLPPGHSYTFRVRGTDKVGNVGAFASRQIRI